MKTTLPLSFISKIGFYDLLLPLPHLNSKTAKRTAAMYHGCALLNLFLAQSLGKFKQLGRQKGYMLVTIDDRPWSIFHPL